MGIMVLRGHSLFQAMTSDILLNRAGDSSVMWLRWINSRLPDPQQQKALLLALQQVHPPSRLRTLRGILIVGSGTWLLAATANAVWEWLVQNWLNAGFAP
jgi:hypothetical protein